MILQGSGNLYLFGPCYELVESISLLNDKLLFVFQGNSLWVDGKFSTIFHVKLSYSSMSCYLSCWVFLVDSCLVDDCVMFSSSWHSGVLLKHDDLGLWTLCSTRVRLVWWVFSRVLHFSSSLRVMAGWNITGCLVAWDCWTVLGVGRWLFSVVAPQGWVYNTANLHIYIQSTLHMKIFTRVVYSLA